MKMKLIIIGLLVITVLSGSAVAQSDQQIDIDELNQDEEACTSIDADTHLCTAETDGETAELTIESDSNQRITITDAGSFMHGGEIHRDTRTITEGRNKIEFPVTTYQGNSALTIDTGDVLFAVPLDRQSSLIDGPVTTSDVQASALGGASAVAFAIILLVISQLREDKPEPERVA